MVIKELFGKVKIYQLRARVEEFFEIKMGVIPEFTIPENKQWAE